MAFFHLLAIASEETSIAGLRIYTYVSKKIFTNVGRICGLQKGFFFDFNQ